MRKDRLVGNKLIKLLQFYHQSVLVLYFTLSVFEIYPE